MHNTKLQEAENKFKELMLNDVTLHALARKEICELRRLYRDAMAEYLHKHHDYINKLKELKESSK